LSTTPNRKDFEGPISSSTVTHSNGLASQIPVTGIDQVKRIIRDVLGNDCVMKTQAYYVLAA